MKTWFRSGIRAGGMAVCLCAALLFLMTGCSDSNRDPLVIGHDSARIEDIPRSAIEAAKGSLHIAYGHTSHGSQITDGMTGLVEFMNGRGYPHDLYAWNNGGSGGALDLRDFYGNFGGSGASDLGNPDQTAWAAATRNFLDDNSDINVIIWSWCGQLSDSGTSVDTYTGLMSALELDYPNVRFVYMTGHTDGSGLNGTLHLNNEKIRSYCRSNGKFLYDFEDIESYDPDGNYFGDKNVADSCDYDGGNWALAWQAAHTIDIDWYDCSSAHSQPLNANRKAYAAWHFWARLAGWDGSE